MAQKPKADKGKALDQKERRFVEEYLVTLDPRKSAIAAGYSESLAASKAYQWVSNRKTKPHVFDAVIEAIEKRSARTEITQDKVLKEYARLGFADIRKAVKWGSIPEMNDDGERVYPVELTASEDMDEDTAAAVSEVSLTAQGVKIKMYDKKAALDSIARHLGMFIDRTEHTGKDGGPIQTEDVSARDILASRLAGLASRTGKGGPTS